MNIEKDLARREKTSKKKTYNYRDYSTHFFLFYPLIILLAEVERFFILLDKKFFYWSKERADKFLDRYALQCFDYDKKTKTYFFNQNWFDWCWARIPKNPFWRKWANKNHSLIQDYVIKEWCPENWDKIQEVDCLNYPTEWIEFKPK